MSFIGVVFLPHYLITNVVLGDSPKYILRGSCPEASAVRVGIARTIFSCGVQDIQIRTILIIRNYVCTQRVIYIKINLKPEFKISRQYYYCMAVVFG